MLAKEEDPVERNEQIWKKEKSCGYSRVTGKEGRASLQKRRDISIFPLVSNEGKISGWKAENLEEFKLISLDMEVNWENSLEVGI